MEDHLRQARARLLLRQIAPSILFDRSYGVNLVDYGTRPPTSAGDDTPALRFHVTKKLAPELLEAAGIKRIPHQIGEFATVVLEGSFHQGLLARRPASSAASLTSHTARFDPLCGGISISALDHYAAGTLGGLVRDRATGADMILSNWHVLVVDWWVQTRKLICQPGRMDNGRARDVVATLSRHAMRAGLDAAVAKLTDDRALVNKQLEIGRVTGVTRAQLGMAVHKSGRTSKVTHGIVTGVDGLTRLTYRGLQRIIRNVVTIVPAVEDDRVSSPGDSGSWWLDERTDQVLGLHFAGGDDPETALAIDMQTVLDALSVDVVVNQPVAETARHVWSPGMRAVPV